MMHAQVFDVSWIVFLMHFSGIKVSRLSWVETQLQALCRNLLRHTLCRRDLGCVLPACIALGVRKLTVYVLSVIEQWAVSLYLQVCKFCLLGAYRIDHNSVNLGSILNGACFNSCALYYWHIQKENHLHLDCWKEAPRQIWSVSKLLRNTKCHPSVRWHTGRQWY